MSDGAPLDRARLLRLLGAAGATAAAGGLGVPAEALASLDSAAGAGFPQPHPRWEFVFVNHATTNPFFAPTRYGIDDASILLGTKHTWTGSRRSNVTEMVDAMQRAIRRRVAGIAVSVIDPHVLDAPTGEALADGIPVVAYNADGSAKNHRLAYVGQDLYKSGLEFGARIVQLVGHGDVFLFIATPGQLNIQPRIDGAIDAIHDSGKSIRATVVATGADVAGERRRIEQTYLDHRSLRGLFAVDGGSTQGIADVMHKHELHRKGVRAGGYDLLPRTLASIADGRLDFTIDQQPYLQGFLPILQLFLYRYSGGLVSPADTNTGLKFVVKENVHPYISSATRFEGSSSRRRYPVG